jgi:hypothetical protein
MASTDVGVIVRELHVGGGVAAALPLLLLLLHPAAGPDHLLLSAHPLPDLPAKVLLYVRTHSNVVVDKKIHRGTVSQPFNFCCISQKIIKSFLLIVSPYIKNMFAENR